LINQRGVLGVIANLNDVTERKEAIELLENERDKFFKIATTAPGLIYSMRKNKDGSLSYPYASHAIKDIYGLEFEEVEKDSNSIFKRIHPDDLAMVIDKINKTKTELVPLKGTYRYLHPTKGLVWHEVNSLPVVEPAGTVICHGIITDITERIEAEQKIIKANRLYHFISQINQMIVRTADEETLFRETCTIAVETGKFKMAWIGLIDELNNELVPAVVIGEDRGYLCAIKTISINEILEGRGPAGTAIRNEKYVICNDIENCTLMTPWKEEALSRGYNSVMVLPIKKSRKIIGVLCLYSTEKNFFDAEEIALLDKATDDVSFALDVFEKEIQNKKAEEAVFQSEKRYHALTEASPVGIFRTDVAGSTTYVNPSWCTMSGLSVQEALGDGWLSAVHKDDRKVIIKGWNDATVTNQESISEYRFERADGTIVWVMGQAIPDRNIENEIVGYIGTVTDITKRKIAEDIIF
jgi:PAS domain S-box-containing protein